MLEHLVSFVENDSLQCRKVDVSALNMIEHTTTSANKEVDTATECSRLVLNVDSTIDSERVKLLGVVLEFCELILHLKVENLVSFGIIEKFNLLTHTLPFSG